MDVIEDINEPGFRRYREGVKNDPRRIEKPYYSKTVRSIKGEYASGNVGFAYNLDTDLWFASANNKAYDRLLEKLAPHASLGSAVFAEGTEALTMVQDASLRLLAGLRALRRNPRRASEILESYKKRRTGVPVGRWTKKSGAWYLEYAWGWKPLFDDVQSTLDRLVEPEWKVISARASATKSDSGGILFPPTKFSWGSSHSVRSTVKYRFSAIVADENTWARSNLGLNNPLEWAWEALPASFIFDYFMNIGQVIGSLDNFAGLRNISTARTRVFQGTQKMYYRNSEDKMLQEGLKHHFSFRYIKREIMPRPEVIPSVVQKWPIKSAARVSTSIALAAQFLIK